MASVPSGAGSFKELPHVVSCTCINAGDEWSTVSDCSYRLAVQVNDVAPCPADQQAASREVPRFR